MLQGDEASSVPADGGFPNGFWRWRADDPEGVFRGLQPQGVLSFSATSGGKLVGHSSLETPFTPGSAMKSALWLIRFEEEVSIIAPSTSESGPAARRKPSSAHAPSCSPMERFAEKPPSP